MDNVMTYKTLEACNQVTKGRVRNVKVLANSNGMEVFKGKTNLPMNLMNVFHVVLLLLNEHNKFSCIGTGMFT